MSKMKDKEQALSKGEVLGVKCCRLIDGITWSKLEIPGGLKSSARPNARISPRLSVEPQDHRVE